MTAAHRPGQLRTTFCSGERVVGRGGWKLPPLAWALIVVSRSSTGRPILHLPAACRSAPVSLDVDGTPKRRRPGRRLLARSADAEAGALSISGEVGRPVAASAGWLALPNRLPTGGQQSPAIRKRQGKNIVGRSDTPASVWSPTVLPPAVLHLSFNRQQTVLTLQGQPRPVGVTPLHASVFKPAYCRPHSPRDTED